MEISVKFTTSIWFVQVWVVLIVILFRFMKAVNMVSLHWIHLNINLTAHLRKKLLTMAIKKILNIIIFVPHSVFGYSDILWQITFLQLLFWDLCIAFNMPSMRGKDNNLSLSLFQNNSSMVVPTFHFWFTPCLLHLK